MHPVQSIVLLTLEPHQGVHGFLQVVLCGWRAGQGLASVWHRWNVHSGPAFHQRCKFPLKSIEYAL